MQPYAEDLVQFLARYALYLVVPGLWFAYVGGVAPWIGGVAGFAAALLLAVPLMLPRRRSSSRREAVDPLDDILGSP